MESALGTGGAGGPGTGGFTMIGGGGVLAIVGAVFESACPHSLQNRASSAAGRPHAGQNRGAARVNGWPHDRQKSAAGETWAPQRGQDDCDCEG